MDSMLLMIVAIASLLLGVLVGLFLGRFDRRKNSETAASELPRLREQLRESETKRTAVETRLEEKDQNHKEKLELLKDARSQLLSEFKNAASEVIDQRQKKFSEMNSNQIGTLLKPLQEQIHKFQGHLQSTREKDSKEMGSLTQQLEQLMKLNQKMSTDAQNLTDALKGSNKTMGTWGELILQRVLETSGLERGREYEIQKEYRNAEGHKYRPDAVIFLPEKKNIIIDSKVSLVSYERAFHAIAENERMTHISDHLTSIKNHISNLSAKKYQELDGLNAPEFVLMFVPIEGALSSAIEAEQELFQLALNNRILLVSPTTLYLSLRIVEQMWKGDRQQKNAKSIATKAGALYNKFEGFVQNMQKIGDKIKDAHGAWEAGAKQLSSGKGNILGKVEELKKLGAETQKEIQEIKIDDSII